MHEQFIIAMEISIVLGTVFYIGNLIRKSFISHSMTVSQNTGDSESVVIQANLSRYESLADRKQHLDELFALCQHRRDYNHAQWLKVKEEAEKEQAAKAAQVQELKPVS
jgi:hypothetical protein